MNKSDKILVTGASGLIGSRLVKHLFENGFTNLRTTSYSRELREHYDGVEHLQGNLQDSDFCEKVSNSVDFVFHAAANTSNDLDTNSALYNLSARLFEGVWNMCEIDEVTGIGIF